MQAAKVTFKEFINDESGQDLIEYALVAALIALGSVLAIKGLSSSISDAFTTVGASVAANV